ncbi:replication initiation protein [Gordonia alkaliphila]|uniref:Primase C-terminal 1 domain-containing protein n=1 Tax=Gordonia alkaliphila TaxID=1053547 RepID=A0ABP8ZLH7_9ACTN
MTATEAPTDDWERLWLPLWPLAGDDLLEGVYRQSRASALGRRYIEANPEALSNLLVVDIDHPDAALRALSARGSHPMPNAVVSNRRNGHAHAVWALSEPVTRTEYARRKPLAYAAAITEGLRRAVDGDTGYSGLLTKNPTHDDWDTEWIHSAGYELDQLAEELGERMPPPRWRETKRQRENVAGLGRNCSLFESARHWAYRETRLFLPTQDADGLGRSIHREVHERNAAFADPLPASEARAIAASIHRWITTRSRMWADGAAVYEATFTTIQAARGRKSAEARKRTIDERIATLRAGV